MIRSHSQVAFLGHIISTDNVLQDSKKIKAVVDWPRLKIITLVKSFLGLVGIIFLDQQAIKEGLWRDF